MIIDVVYSYIGRSILVFIVVDCHFLDDTDRLDPVLNKALGLLLILEEAVDRPPRGKNTYMYVLESPRRVGGLYSLKKNP